MVCDDRRWKLTAPWWAWPKLGTPGRDPLETAPLLQMYEASDPVSGFVKEPQKRLAFGPDDVVQQVVAYPAPAPGAKKPRISNYYLVPDPAGTRKVFLPSHKRFYLVVCELHCDSAGLPSVTRDKTCEAGFVVRRRRLSFGAEYAEPARKLLAKINGLSGELAALERGGTRGLLKKRARLTPGGVFGAMAGVAPPPAPGSVSTAVEAKQNARRAALRTELQAARAELRQWKESSGAVSLAEGWIPDADAENVGAWAVVDETPEAIEEVIYPLSPLVADPARPEHDATGKTIWFGMVPVGSREVEVSGAARFDDATRYEVRCFVRRHRCDCPRTGERNDCGGELVWSAPTAVFQLASHFDPVGTGNHPITIQMPDIPTLAASVGARLPVQMKFPSNSALNIQSGDDFKPSNPSTNAGFPQICFFSIPLITIIATFVLNLFLPIVVFLFGLWFLLGLKFCIPPSISFSAGASLHAGLEGKLGLEIQGKLDAQINASAEITGNLGADFNLATVGMLKSDGSPTLTGPDGSGNYVPAADTPGALVTAGDPPATPGTENTGVRTLQLAMTADRTAEVDAGDVTKGLAWVPRVERWEVGA